MRSALPKVLHPLCGRPLIAWPVAAAREAGAARVVVVDNPKRRLEEHLPEGVELAIQEQPLGTGDAVAAAAAADRSRGRRSWSLNGDVPLITAEAIAELVEAHDGAGAATMATMELDDPGAYGRVVRDGDGSVVRVVEAKGGTGDATPEELAIREVNTGVFAFDGGALLEALQQLGRDNAQGEVYLPDVLPALRDAGKTVAAHVVTDTALTLGVNDRAELAEVRALAQQRINVAHMRAGRHDRRPGVDHHRRHGHARHRRHDRAVRAAHGHARASAPAARSAP